MSFDLRRELERFGAPRGDVVLLSEPGARNIRYLDLIPQPRLKAWRPMPVPIDAVVESAGQAVAYVVRADIPSRAQGLNPSNLKLLRHNLACRGDAEFLLVWKPGQIEVFAVGLSETLPQGTLLAEQERPLILQEIAGRTFDRQNDAVQQAVHDVLFQVLTEVSSALSKSPACADNLDDVISLVGRALFARFLIDRGIINPETFPELFHEGTPERCFDTPALAAATCDWLHLKFNGEMLPLSSEKYTEYFQDLSTRDACALGHLSNILHRSPGGQLSFELYWNTVNFAHVPVGLLSQVYEHYAHKLFAKGAKAESIYYTPRFIAEFITNEAFNGIPSKSRHAVKLLDPAVGAGIFLVIAFRRLVAETWEKDRERPNFRTIRRILREQIFGFDINEVALRLASLSLYLTALELDPNPFPPSKLKFHKLLGSNLFMTRAQGEEYPKNTVLGSLGPGAPSGHEGRYDIVIGNPPWTAWKDSEDAKRVNAYVSTMTRAIAEMYSDSETLVEAAQSYMNPDKVPDLPFVWRSIGWAKKGGILAFALHGRLLFKQTDVPTRARNSLFSAVRVLAIVNGSEHADNFWPGVNQPFCLFFAENAPATDSDTFLFLTPDPDTNLIPDGRFRIDYQSAEPVQLSVLKQNPSLLKTLAVGSALEADMVRRIDHFDDPTAGSRKILGLPEKRAFMRFGDFWNQREELEFGQGYRSAKKQKQNSAQFIKDMGAKDLTKHSQKDEASQFLVVTSKLADFDKAELEMPRRKEIYLPPLLLVSEAPGPTKESVRARVVLDSQSVAYTESFYGFSASGHPDGDLLVRYGLVIFNSSLFVFRALMKSSKFGAERRALLLEDVLDFPVVPFDLLTSEEKSEVMALSDGLLRGPQNDDWERLESWVYKLYDLCDTDRQLVADTLGTRLPYSKTRRYATSAPTQSEAEEYVSAIEKALKPMFSLAGCDINCQLSPLHYPPWIFFDVFVAGTDVATSHVDISALIAKVANQQGATRLVLHANERHIRIAVLAQRRYFTKTRSRSMVFYLVNQFSDRIISSLQ